MTNHKRKSFIIAVVVIILMVLGTLFHHRHYADCGVACPVHDLVVFIIVTIGFVFTYRILRDLSIAMDEIKVLRRILPICSFCKSIRCADEEWHKLEEYLDKTVDVKCSHGVCPSCAKEHYSNMDLYDE